MNTYSHVKMTRSLQSVFNYLIFQDEERKYLDNDKVYTPPQLPIVTDMPPLLSLLYTDKLKNAGREVSHNHCVFSVIRDPGVKKSKIIMIMFMLRVCAVIYNFIHTYITFLLISPFIHIYI